MPWAPWSRLRQTRFARVLLGYVALSWGVFIILDKLFLVLGVPRVASQVSLAVLVVGFFVVGYVAWIRAGDELAEILGPNRARQFDDILGRAWVRRSAAVGVIALVAGGGWIALRDRFGPEPLRIPSLLADGVAPRLVVLPFDVEGLGASSWRNDAVEFLGAGLDGISNLEVTERSRVVAGWGDGNASRDPARAIRYARDLGGHFVVTGQVRAERGVLLVSARVFETAAGRQLGSEIRARGSAEAPAFLMDSLAIGILRVLEADDAELARVSVARARTASPAAFRAFVAGEDAFRGARFAEAIERYQEAVAADSTFALAELGLGLAVDWYEESANVSQREYLERAVRHGDRLDERNLKLAQAALALDWHDLIGIDLLRELAASQDPKASFLLADAYYHYGQAMMLSPAEADSALALATRLDPELAPAWIHRVHLAFRIHADSAAAAALIDSLERRGPGSAAVARSREAFALAFGDAESRVGVRAGLGRMPTSHLWSLTEYLDHPRLLPVLAEVLGELRRRPDDAAVAAARQRLAWVEIDRGRLDTAWALVDDPANPIGFLSEIAYRARQEGAAPPSDLVEYALSLPPDRGTPPTTSFYAGANAAANASWDEVGDAVGRLYSDAEYRRSQADWEAERMSAAAGSALDAYARAFSGLSDELRARLVTESARMAGTQSGMPQVSAAVRWWIADMAGVAGNRQEEERALLSFWNDPYAALRLARVYADQGREAEARASARLALDAWSGADPELAPQVAAAREIAGDAP